MQQLELLASLIDREPDQRSDFIEIAAAFKRSRGRGDGGTPGRDVVLKDLVPALAAIIRT